MLTTPKASEGDAEALVCDLAGVGAAVDAAAVQLAGAIRDGASWIDDIRRVDVVAIAEASACLEAALARVLHGKSSDLATRLLELAELARETAEAEVRSSRARPVDLANDNVVALIDVQRIKRSVPVPLARSRR